MDADSSAEQSRMNLPPSMASEAPSPMATEESAAMADAAMQPMDLNMGGAQGEPVGDQNMIYEQDGSHQHPEDSYAAPAESYLDPAASSYEPAQDIAEEDDPPVLGIPGVPSDAAAENAIDTVIIWYDAHELLHEEERRMLGRLKHIMLDFLSTGIVDRSRYV
ncbi:hypothetical protein NM688_g6710 [Phlebia brevispora]|uniref:Uncharacterized protein n=1 Tax=Phlebia brevispora TaxID=194682 RepID=A0ACC1SDK7_9APHY|nr:hypothetical protein NM688_g6710 [Phlebia brevispora]